MPKHRDARSNPAAETAKKKKTQMRARVSNHNNTIIPRTPIKAATTATPAGFSAPLVPKVPTGGVTDFVGVPPALPMGVMGAFPVPFADKDIAVPVPDTCAAVAFAGRVAKLELAVARIGAEVDTTVLFDEEGVAIVVGVA